MVFLYFNFYEKKYSSHVCSCATIFCLIAFLMTIILPYIVVYATGGIFINIKQLIKRFILFRNVAKASNLL